MWKTLTSYKLSSLLVLPSFNCCLRFRPLYPLFPSILPPFLVFFVISFVPPPILLSFLPSLFSSHLLFIPTILVSFLPSYLHLLFLHFFLLSSFFLSICPFMHLSLHPSVYPFVVLATNIHFSHPCFLHSSCLPSFFLTLHPSVLSTVPPCSFSLFSFTLPSLFFSSHLFFCPFFMPAFFPSFIIYLPTFIHSYYPYFLPSFFPPSSFLTFFLSFCTLSFHLSYPLNFLHTCILTFHLFFLYLLSTFFPSFTLSFFPVLLPSFKNRLFSFSFFHFLPSSPFLLFSFPLISLHLLLLYFYSLFVQFLTISKFSGFCIFFGPFFFSWNSFLLDFNHIFVLCCEVY